MGKPSDRCTKHGVPIHACAIQHLADENRALLRLLRRAVKWMRFGWMSAADVGDTRWKIIRASVRLIRLAQEKEKEKRK